MERVSYGSPHVFRRHGFCLIASLRSSANGNEQKCLPAPNDTVGLLISINDEREPRARASRVFLILILQSGHGSINFCLGNLYLEVYFDRRLDCIQHVYCVKLRGDIPKRAVSIIHFFQEKYRKLIKKKS